MTRLPPALFSDCGGYRYILTRDSGMLTHCGVLLWIMLNPSTADATQDDPTIRRVQGFTRSWGYRVAVVCNLFAARTTNPKRLAEFPDPVGPENDRHILDCAGLADGIALAWGAHRMATERGQAVIGMIRRASQYRHFNFLCLGLTDSGAPKHPLYVRADTEALSWDVAMKLRGMA